MFKYIYMHACTYIYMHDHIVYIYIHAYMYVQGSLSICSPTPTLQDIRPSSNFGSPEQEEASHEDVEVSRLHGSGKEASEQGKGFILQATIFRQARLPGNRTCCWGLSTVPVQAPQRQGYLEIGPVFGVEVFCLFFLVGLAGYELCGDICFLQHTLKI